MDINTAIYYVNNLTNLTRPMREYEVLVHESLCDFIAAHARRLTLLAEGALEDERNQRDNKTKTE